MEIITDESLAEKGFEWREKNGVRVLVCEPLENAGFVNGFSTRMGGTSPFPENALSLSGFDNDTAENIAENRRRFIDVFGGHWQLASCWQVHSDIVRVALTDDQVKEDEQKCDGVISDLTGVLAGNDRGPARGLGIGRMDEPGVEPSLDNRMESECIHGNLPFARFVVRSGRMRRHYRRLHYRHCRSVEA